MIKLCENLKHENVALKQEVNDLGSKNLVLTEEIGHLQLHSREKFLIFSGPAIKYDKDTHPANLISVVKEGLRNHFNVDFSPDLIASCRKFGRRDAASQQILVEFTSLTEKNRIRSLTLPKRKDANAAASLHGPIESLSVQSASGSGPNFASTHPSSSNQLYVNEFLSSYHSNLLYRLRTLKKERAGILYSCFSRNGKIYYKTSFNSNPIYVKSVAFVDRLSMTVP